jgi:hypothetical protein
VSKASARRLGRCRSVRGVGEAVNEATPCLRVSVHLGPAPHCSPITRIIHLVAAAAPAPAPAMTASGGGGGSSSNSSSSGGYSSSTAAAAASPAPLEVLAVEGATAALLSLLVAAAAALLIHCFSLLGATAALLSLEVAAAALLIHCFLLCRSQCSDLCRSVLNLCCTVVGTWISSVLAKD